MTKLSEKLNGWPYLVIGILVLGGVAYGAFYTYRNLEIERVNLLTELSQTREANYELMRIVDEREEVINSFQGQIQSIAGTVGTLEKLSKTDEELLQKYSKVYFLNENYVPKTLIDIDSKYLNKGAVNIQIHSQVWPYLEKLLVEANGEGLDLRVASAYRSFETQSALKSSYAVTYGSGANKFSADQGYSEHQLGTAVDFTTQNLGANFSAFAATDAYQWLKKNAYRFGFILSYPEINSYYKFEPWHWRFVGVELARNLQDDGRYFYDLSQRDIDRYLIKIFD
jgi:LAS superfamily LD-carboxypeptidase LdcB